MPRWLVTLLIIAVAATVLGFVMFVPGVWGH